jgi:intracellular septation protein A
MNLVFLVLALVPIVAFVWLDAKAGPKQAIIGATVLSFLLLGANLWILKQFDWIAFAEPVLFLVMGVISFKLNNTRFFKLQPCVLSGIFCVVLLAYHFSGNSLFVRYLPLMKNAVEPEVWKLLNSPDWVRKFSRLEIVLGVVFAFHAYIMYYTAIKSSNTKWILARLSIYPLMMIATVACFVDF